MKKKLILILVCFMPIIVSAATESTCLTDSGILKTIYIFKLIIEIICIIVPVLLIVTLMIQLFKTIFNEGTGAIDLKGCLTKIIAAIVIFMLPTLISLVLGLINYDSSYIDNCWKNATIEKIEELEAIEKAEKERKRQERLEEIKRKNEETDIGIPGSNGGEESPIGTNTLPMFTSTSTISKDKFIKCMNEYSNRGGTNAFRSNFLGSDNDKNGNPDIAELIYDTSISEGINPELVVSHAAIESGFSHCKETFNFWSVGIGNGKGCYDGKIFTSIDDGVRGFAKVLKSYQNQNSTAYKMIMTRYNERKNASCVPGGYGTPDTLNGMYSIYGHLGTYLANTTPDTAGAGGCYFLEYWNKNGFLPQTYTDEYIARRCPDSYVCSNPSSGGGSCVKTTICEQSDFTLYVVKTRLDKNSEIFGSCKN